MTTSPFSELAREILNSLLEIDMMLNFGPDEEIDALKKVTAALLLAHSQGVEEVRNGLIFECYSGHKHKSIDAQKLCIKTEVWKAAEEVTNKAVLEEREACCGAMCSFCDVGEKVEYREYGGLNAYVHRSGEINTPCTAQPIHRSRRTT